MNGEPPPKSGFLHPTHHLWQESLRRQVSVDDVGDFARGTLQEADIIVSADTTSRVFFTRAYALKAPPLSIEKGDTRIGL